ncbi:MAG: type II and III secretion system protein family protein [Alphaproteobacteria bacterium]|nr:type II and III secretion system protein family protein [Alphaproteobacteria bacterium]
MYPLLRLALTGTFLGICFAAIGHAGQPAVGAPPNRDPAPASDAARLIPATGRPIELEVNKGTLVRLARPANTVFVADPDIADVQVKSPELVYIAAKSPGATVIYAVDGNDNVLLNAPVRVAFDLADLRHSLQQLVPDGLISADSAGGDLVLSGKVGNAGQAEKVQALAAAFIGSVKGGKVINRMSVVTPNQVNLQVRIAEVDRSIMKQIGVDWTKFGSNGNYRFQTLNNQSPRNITSVSPGATTVSNGVVTITPPSITSAIPTTSFLTIGMFPFSTSATIEAMATEGFITILAEPNLTAVSGQTANFLAGGSFPVPVIQSVSTGAPTVTVQFQQYGVQLAFTPTITDSRHLSLKVAPQVSQLDYSNAVTENGFTIPALTIRSAQTTVDLASGQSFALAGLLMHNTSQDINKVPWLGDIPILGALFRSTKFNNNETELVIVVTPYLVQPPETVAAAPTDGFEAPHDAQQVLFGDTWRRGLPAPARGPLDAGGSGLIGPAGFRLD